METFRSFIDANMVPIIFAYGLTFFAAGLVIIVQRQQMSNFRLARYIWMLGAFGMMHGVAEWGDIFIPIQSPFISDFWIARLADAQHIIWAASFAILLQFAVSMLLPRLPLIHRIKTFILWFAPFWSLAVIITGVIFLPDSLAQSWIRYSLGFPAAAMTAVSFLLERKTFATYRESSRLNLTLIAAAFGAYAFLSGLIVPEKTLPGLGWLNYENVRSFTLMPIYFWRMLVGLCITLLIIRTMHYFDLEFRERLEATEREQALTVDRLRIARDLHDGVVQSIYAVGLQLEVVAGTMVAESGETAQLIRRLINQLNDVITNIRRYIYNIAVAGADDAGFDQFIQKLADEFSAAGSIPVKISVIGRRRALTPRQKQNIAFVAQECLSNVIKHAGATAVEIKFDYQPSAMLFSVTDNGVGFEYIPTYQADPTGGRGLRGMRERAEALHADFEIVSNTGAGGAMISMRIPYKSEKGQS